MSYTTKPELFSSPFLQSVVLDSQALEAKLNTASHFPLLSSLSGHLRVCMGTMQAVVAVAAMALYSVAALFHPKKRQELLGEARKSSYLFTRAIKNQCRALVEIIPLVGNLLCYTYDTCYQSHRTYFIY